MKCRFPALCGTLTALLLISAAPALPQTASISVPTVGTLPTPLMMHGSAMVGNRLYVIGGNKQAWGWTDEVHSGEIAADGIIKNWRKEASLPERRAYLANGVEVVNGCIYVISGSIAAAGNTNEAQLERAKTLLWARVEADGAVKEWKTASLPEADIAFTATCSTDRHLVITGGSSQGKYSDKVCVSKLDRGGAPFPWKLAGAMPSPRAFHNAAHLGNRIYVWGGLSTSDRSKVEATAYSTSLDSDSSLGAWRAETDMPQPVFSSACAGYGDILFTVGGRYTNSYPTNAIWTYRLNSGQKAEWTMLQSDLKSRVFHSLAIDGTRGWVFVTGGRDKKIPAAGDGARLDVIQAFRVN